MRVADCSSLRFIYPFTFRPDTYPERVRAMDDPESVWLAREFNAGEMLAHAANYLDREAGHSRVWALTEQTDMLLRLSRDLQCRLVADQKEIPFTFGGADVSDASVELALFAIGVGFLTIAARPSAADVSSWLAFQHYFRVMNDAHNVSLVIHQPADPMHWSAFAGQQYVFSLEGGSFVAFNAPGNTAFFRSILPAHLRDKYFLMLLLVLHQRFALMRFSHRVSWRWSQSTDQRSRKSRMQKAQGSRLRIFRRPCNTLGQEPVKQQGRCSVN